MSGRLRLTRAVTVAAALVLLWSGMVAAQELEPGSYQNAPDGANAFFLSYGYSTGNVLVDATLPIEGANAKVHGLGVGYLRAFNLFGKTAKFDAVTAISHAHFEGVVAGEFRTRTPSGLTDPRVRLSVNLVGSPSLDLPSYVKYRQRTIVGVSLQAALPLGQYDADRLINLGANRWSFRPEIGLSQAAGRWVLEAAAGAWVFTKNGENYGGTTLEQNALYFAKASAMYVFRRNLWIAASYGRATGGETLVNGIERNDLQRNDRAGLAAVLPISRQSALRLTYTSGLSTRLGADFDTVGVGYQYSWGGRMPARSAAP